MTLECALEVKDNMEQGTDLKLVSKKKKPHPLRYIILGVAFVFFMISAFMMIASNNKEVKQKQQELDTINAQISIQELKNVELENYANYSDEEYMQYVIKKAHKELDYVKKGERVFTIVAGN